MFALLALTLAPVDLPADGWIAIEQPLVDRTVSMGCKADGTASLASDEGAWLSGDSSREFERFTVYVELDEGQPEAVRMFTPDCTVTDANLATDVNLESAEAVALFDAWLDAEHERDIDAPLVTALAHIDDASVNDVLEGEAGDLSDEDAAQHALFWLAQRRGEPGREIVVRHLDARWPLEHRKQAVMALALSENDAAWNHVRDVARNAPADSLRAHAVTALGITDAPGALPDLHSIFLADKSADVRRQAIFGIAQLDTQEAAETLVRIARDPRHGELRRDALFWLANMDDEASGELLEGLLETAL